MSGETLIQSITQQIISVENETTVTLKVIEGATAILSQGVIGPIGPMGPAGGEEAAMPEFPIVDVKTSSALAAGASVNLDSVLVDIGKIGKVQQITLSSSAACKWEIQTSDTGVQTTLDIVFTSGFSGQAPSHEWEPPHKDYAMLMGDGATTFFRVIASNLDSRSPANVYVTFMFDEVTP